MPWRSAAHSFVALAVVALLSTAAIASGLPYSIKFQVYDGPHTDTGKSWKSKTIDVVPGTQSEKDFLDNYSKSNPGLVQSYLELTKDSTFTKYLRQDLALKGSRPTITLVDDSKKYVDRKGDGHPDTDDKAQSEYGVWPHARGNNLYISQSYLGTYPNLDSVHHLLIHELSHTQDDTNRDKGDYGPDDSHFGDEAMYNHGHKFPWIWKGAHYSSKAAFVEGWAEYMALGFNPAERPGYVNDVKDIRQETSSGEYDTISWKDASYAQLASVEHINSLILYDLHRFLPGGQQKIFEAFKATNRGSRNLIDLLHELIERHPEDAYAVAGIFDAYTRFGAPDSELDKLLGKDLAARYRKEWRKKAQAQNQDGTVQGAENVGRWAAASTQIAAAQDELAILDKKIHALEGWDLSPWDLFGGGGSILVRHYLRQRERNELILRRKALADELEQLQTPQRSLSAAAGTVLLPPPAAPDPSAEGEQSIASSAPASPSGGGKPASGVEGASVDWGR